MQNQNTALGHLKAMVPIDPSMLKVFGGALYAGQKTRAYDRFGQLREQKTEDAINHTYEYDAIGNRLNVWQGDPIDPSTALDTYTPNNLNQYSVISASSAVNPDYDLDGNFEQQGGWEYEWNTENRMKAAEQFEAQRVEYTYDGNGRRTSKEVFDWDASSGSYLSASSYVYIYDGWNLIFEICNSESQIQTTKSFAWGTDLSGSLQGDL